MQNILTPDELIQLVTTGIVEVTDDLIIRMAESCDLDENAHIHLD